MLCEKCRENQASFVISTLVDSSARQISVCEECATGDMKYGVPDVRRGSGTGDRECPQCHSRYSRSTPLGCPTCYAEFSETLIPFLRRIHGSIVHTGKTPVDTPLSSSTRAGKSGPSHSATRAPCLPASTDLSARFPAEAEWMQGNGPDCDVVISTRVRLARNISGHVFCNSADESELQRIAETVEDAVAEINKHADSPLRDAFTIELSHLSAIDREFLVERHLISRDLAERNGTRKVIVGEKEVVSIMLNEEDHIRLQVINAGLQPRQSWETINAIDDELGRKIDYAFSPNWGYLTACPTNVGTGLRVSVMLHIPALTASRLRRAQGFGSVKGGDENEDPYDLCPMLRAISDMGYTVRGMYGEGSEATGAFYQMSNEATLGQSEEEIVDRIRSVARQIVEREREERQLLIKDKKVEDRVFRSYGTLMNARLISSKEASNLLSWVSLGVNIGILSELSRTDIARLLVLIRPAHLQKYEGRELDAMDRDMIRAVVIREKLSYTSFSSK